MGLRFYNYRMLLITRLFHSQSVRRQDAEQKYIRDGTVYAFRCKTVAQFENIYGRDVRPLIIDPADSCELDTEADWQAVEARWNARVETPRS